MFRSLLTVVFAFVLVGCDAGERAKLEKENQELRRERDAALSLDSQAKCAKDAKIWFSENWQPDKNTIMSTYTNHYNKAQNKCFVYIFYNFHQGAMGSWVESAYLYDVYENNKVGEVTITHRIGLKPEFESTDTRLSCDLVGKSCKTRDEFDEMVKPYMNN